MIEEHQSQAGWTYICWYHWLLYGSEGVAKIKAANAAYFKANSFTSYIAKRRSK